MRKNRYTAIDLFSGAGGLSLGLIKAGFQVIASVEMWDLAAETYSLNFRNHNLYKTDIRKLSPKTVMADLGLKKGDLDLLAGCPPCQGFSTHRTRNRSPSVQDERNELIFEFLKYVKAMLPKTIMMENVPGLSKDDRMKCVLKELSEMGYILNNKSVQVKNAADYGVPQRRRRMILQASRFGEIEDAKKCRVRKTVRDAIGVLKKVGESGDPIHDYQPVRSEKVKKIISLVPKNGGSRSQLPRKYWLPCHIRNPNSYRDVYGRMKWDDIAPTITGGCNNPSKGRFLHPEEDRAITLREAALLQSFPKRFKFPKHGSKDAIALLIGNALPPEFIKKHAVKFREHLEKAGA